MEGIKRFSDFKIESERKMLSGESIKINDLLDKEIIILDFVIFDSIMDKGKKCLKIQFKFENNETINSLTTGSSVLMKQIQYKELEFPFIGKIIKEKKYYKFA